MDAAIAIPCITPNALVARCVAECRAKCPGAEIYVVADEAKPDEYGADICVIVTGHVTMATKRNLVARKSQRTFLAFIDSDAYPDQGWLQNAIAILERNLDVWIVGGPNISPPDQSASERYVGSAQRSYLLTGAYAFRKRRARPRYVDDLPSCNMVLRRGDYLAIGGMREDLYIYEDKYLCAKVVDFGKRISFTPDVTVFHKNRTLKMLALQRLAWGASLWQGLRSSKIRLYLLLPSFAVCFFLSFPLALATPYWAVVYGLFAGIYVCLVVIEVLRHAERIADWPGVFAALVIGNLAPGVGSILGPLGVLPDLRTIYRND